MELENTVIMVAGASTGIGLLAARQLAQAGAHVVMAARSLATLEAEAAQLPNALAVELDVTNDESADRAIARVMARHGRIDVLINNAGNGGTLALFIDTPSDYMRAMFDVHVLGMERMTRRVLPIMLSQGAGTIMNVASAVGDVPMPGAVAYSAAKAAVVAFSHGLRGELASTAIEVVLYSPPHTQTKAGADWPLNLPKQFSPEFSATAMVNALRRDRREVLAGGNRPLWWLQRLSPALANTIMRKIGMSAVQRSLVVAKR